MIAGHLKEKDRAVHRPDGIEVFGELHRRQRAARALEHVDRLPDELLYFARSLIDQRIEHAQPRRPLRQLDGPVAIAGPDRSRFGHHLPQRQQVHHAAAHRAHVVQVVGDWCDAPPADRIERGLESVDAAIGRRSQDRAAGLRSDGRQALTGRHAAAEPLLEPPGVKSTFKGLRVADGSNEANSVVTVLPRRIAPAWRNWAATGASAAAGAALVSFDPARVGNPFTSTISLMPIVTPANGPSGRPAAIAASSSRAARRAPKPSTTTQARMRESLCSIARRA